MEVTVVVKVDEMVMVEACARGDSDRLVALEVQWVAQCGNGAGVRGDEDSGNGGQQRYCY